LPASLRLIDGRPTSNMRTRRTKKARRDDAGATPAGRKACVESSNSGGAPPLDLPISDNPEITQTTIFPTIEAMWMEFSALPWFEKYSPETRRTLRFAFYTGVAETLRTIAFRINADQDTSVFTDFDKELRAYDRELQTAVEAYNAALQ
jgi:hypothetical protein